MPTPTDPKLYQEVKDFIMSKYKKNSAGVPDAELSLCEESKNKL